MMMTRNEIRFIGPDPVEGLARDYVNARGVGMDLLMMVGGGGESLLRHLPEATRDKISAIMCKTMSVALRAAGVSRKITGRCPVILERVIPAATGALSGIAGVPGALADMPVIVTLILRSILNEAQSAGFDTSDPEVQAEAIRVLAYAGPLDEDDGADFALLVTKATVTGTSLTALTRSVASRLTISMSQKVAAQAVPVLGAIAGMSINLLFTNYYREMARIHFSALRIAQTRQVDPDTVLSDLRKKAREFRDQRGIRRLS